MLIGNIENDIDSEEESTNIFFNYFFAFETFFRRQTRVKVNITHKDPYDPTHTIQYRERKTYFFDAEKSNGNKEEDLVDVINIAYVVSTL